MSLAAAKYEWFDRVNLNQGSKSNADSLHALAAISITKTSHTTSLVAGSTTNYTITVANAGSSHASGTALGDTVSSGLSCTGIGVQCGGPNIALANLVTGFAIANFPSGIQLTLSLVCSVTATARQSSDAIIFIANYVKFIRVKTRF